MINDIAIVSVSQFIMTELETKTNSKFVVKSDTNGNDLEIFDCFVKSIIRNKIDLYVLELILNGISKPSHFYNKLLQFSHLDFSVTKW